MLAITMSKNNGPKPIGGLAIQLHKSSLCRDELKVLTFRLFLSFEWPIDV